MRTVVIRNKVDTSNGNTVTCVKKCIFRHFLGNVVMFGNVNDTWSRVFGTEPFFLIDAVRWIFH